MRICAFKWDTLRRRFSPRGGEQGSTDDCEPRRMDGCCAPSRRDAGSASAAEPRGEAATAVHALPTAFARIPAGEFLQGSTDVHAYPGDGEGPVRPVRLDEFDLAPHAVTNREF